MKPVIKAKIEQKDGLLDHNRNIFHILPADDWEQAKINGIYAPASLEAEGFIHCSTRDQVINTANSFFKGQSDMILLWILEHKVQPEIRYEDLLGEGTLFPHIYGQLNLDSVEQTSKLRRDEDGDFIFPASPDDE